MTASLREEGGDTPVRYEGLDLFRPLSIFGVVLFHFPTLYEAASDPAFRIMLGVRDCAFPIIILTSSFVITRSLLLNPNRSFSQFATTRFRRLVVPALAWSALYWLLFEVFGPIGRGQPAKWPPLSLVVSGYSHLWFLLFLFLGSLMAYPAVRVIARAARAMNGAAWAWAAACAAAAVVYSVWGRPFLTAQAASALGEQADLHLRVAVGQSIAYAKYPLLGVAVALMAGAINALYRRPAFRAASVVVVAGACLAHVALLAPAVSRTVYAMAVFVALLRPWPPGRLDWLRPIARLSYPVYILHPLAAQVLMLPLGLWPVAPSIPGLLAGSLVVFALSAAAAVLLRGLGPARWFLPTVPVNDARARAGMR